MFVAIYRFEIHPGKDEPFKEAWRALTELIYQYENSLGSHLHLSLDEANCYIAYAQWPDKETWEKSGDKPPDSAAKWRSQMRENCVEISTLHTIESVDDYTQQETSK